jgi:hypothetical protein
MVNELPPEDKEKYLTGLARYVTLEKEKWQATVQPKCLARQDNDWIKNTCRITDDICRHTNCFALQLIKHAKGFL